MPGSIHALAKWFQMSVDKSGSEDDFAREEVIDNVMKATHWGEEKDYFIFRSAEGRVIVEQGNQDGTPLVFFDFVARKTTTRLRFWMNKSSVEELLERAKARAIKVPFETLFINE